MLITLVSAVNLRSLINITATKFKLITAALILLLFAGSADGNTSIKSFHSAKKNLEKSIYFDNRKTVYCSASFDSKKNIVAAEGFETTKYINRKQKLIKAWACVLPELIHSGSPKGRVSRKSG